MLIASRSEAEHFEHLRQLFARLQQAGLVVNIAKCEFGRAEYSFLGHRVNSRDVIPLPDVADHRRWSATIPGHGEFLLSVCTPRSCRSPASFQCDEQ